MSEHEEGELPEEDVPAAETGLYVGQGPGGQYNVYDRYTGQAIGQGWWNQGAAERYYNEMMGLPNASLGGARRSPGPGYNPLAGLGWMLGGLRAPSQPVVGGMAQLDPYMQALQQEYLRLRLSRIEEPTLRNLQTQAAWAMAKDMVMQQQMRGRTPGNWYGQRNPFERAWAMAVNRFKLPEPAEEF